MKIKYKTPITIGERPEYYQLSSDLQWEECNKYDALQVKKKKQNVRSWIVTALFCSIPLTYIAYKPLNDAVGIIASGVSTIGWINSSVAPNTSHNSNQDNLTSGKGFSDPNVAAFADTLAYAEGLGDSYNLGYMFKEFDMTQLLDSDPVCDSNGLCSAVFGRYQYKYATYKPYADKLSINDMLPESQDRVLEAHLKSLGVYDRIVKGDQSDIKKVFCEIGKVWASLPCNTYGQRQYSADTLISKFDEFQKVRNTQKSTNEGIGQVFKVGDSWNLLGADDKVTNMIVGTVTKQLGIKLVADVTTTSTDVKTNSDRKGSYMIMVDSGDMFEGMKLYNLNLIKDGSIQETIQVVSGQPGSEPIKNEDQQRDNYKPIPNGEYSLDAPENIPYDPAMGTKWIGIRAKDTTDTGGRSGFGFHTDQNRSIGSAGTAGCVSPKNDQDIDKISTWVNDGATTLVVSLFATQKDIVVTTPNNSVVATQNTTAVTTPNIPPETADTSNSKLKFNFVYDSDVPQHTKDLLDKASGFWKNYLLTDLTITVNVHNVDADESYVAAIKQSYIAAAKSTHYRSDNMVDVCLMNINVDYKLSDYLALQAIKHELGHCLGIGTSPNFNAAVLDGKNYNANTIAGADYGGSIPIDNGHISEDIGGDELMTPTIESDNIPMPLSYTTLYMLKDIGHVLNDDYIKYDQSLIHLHK